MVDEATGQELPAEEGWQPDLVEELMAGCLEEPAGPRRERRVEDACRTHPGSADELCRRLAALSAMGLDELAGADGAAAGEEPVPAALGDFHLLERLGGGGMGVVYRAEQRSLGREVAVKLVRPEQLYFPGARERFRREVEAIARLEHPGIVAVHAVGEERGVPYFAMERVEGRTLAEVIAVLEGRAPERLTGADLARALGLADVPEWARGRSWIELACRLAIQVAEALEHAHERGVLHRDVKPSNVIVTPAGRARLVDFGLTAAEGATRVTRTGSQLGTLHYMSPEQLRTASRVDRRTDVYSLGATLCELLTLQPPVSGDTRPEVEAAVLAGRPPEVRARNRRVSPELELVVRTAMEPDRERRYATAADLAADLEAALALRPIVARPPGALLRARRWCQRRPAAATALALGFLVVVVGPALLSLQAWRHAGELADSLARETAARRAREDEAARAGALVELLTSVFYASDPDVAKGEDVTARELLDRALVDLEDLGNARAQAELRAVLAPLLGRMGYAPRALEEARRSLDELAAFPEAAEVRATLLHETAVLLDREGSWAEGLARAGEYGEVARAVPPVAWRDAHVAFLRERARLELGEEGASVEALTAAAERVDAEAAPAAVRGEVHVALGRLHHAAFERSFGADHDAAVRALRELERAQEAFAGARGGRALALAEAQSRLATMLGMIPMPAESERLARAALATLEERLDPADPRVHAARFNLGVLIFKAGRAREGLAEIERVRAALEELAPEDENLVEVRGTQAGILYELREWEGLPERFERVLEEQARLVGAEAPEVGVSWHRMGCAHLGLGDREAARACFDEAERILRAGSPFRTQRLDLLSSRVLLRLGEGDVEGGAALAERARAELEDAEVYVPGAAYLDLALAARERGDGDLEAALRRVRSAAERAAVRARWDEPRIRVELALAELLDADGRADEALAGLARVEAALAASELAADDLSAEAAALRASIAPEATGGSGGG